MCCQQEASSAMAPYTDHGTGHYEDNSPHFGNCLTGQNWEKINMDSKTPLDI